MKLSEKINALQKHLDGGLPSLWLWIVGDLQELGVQAIQLEADRDEYRNLYHLAEAKISSREAIIGQLSEGELAKDVTRLEAELDNTVELSEAKNEELNRLTAENEELRELFVYFFGENYEELAKG